MNAEMTTASGAAGIAPDDEIEATIASTKFIDIHAHCTEFELPPVYIKGKRPLCVPEDLLAHYDRLGVEKGAILALCNPENFIGGMSTEQILRVCAQAPDRFIPSVGADPRGLGNNAFGDFEFLFKWYRDKGCRICGEVCANLHFLDPRVQNYFKGCEAAGLPLTFHVAADENWLYGLVDERGLPNWNCACSASRTCASSATRRPSGARSEPTGPGTSARDSPRARSRRAASRS